MEEIVTILTQESREEGLEQDVVKNEPKYHISAY